MICSALITLIAAACGSFSSSGDAPTTDGGPDGDRPGSDASTVDGPPSGDADPGDSAAAPTEIARGLDDLRAIAVTSSRV